MKTRRMLVGAAVLVGVVLPGLALQQKRASPHETINLNMGAGARVVVTYGRPNMADPKTKEKREIWGKLVPAGKVWRMGADEATQLATEKPLEIGGLQVPAGGYTLYMLPADDGSAKLIINKVAASWGAYTYKEEMDLGRVDMKMEKLDTPVEQFTIALAKEGDGAMLKASWADRAYSVPVKVMKGEMK